MNRLAYLLIFLLTSAQVDDYWTVATNSLSAPLTDDDDEYLPSQRQVRVKQSSSRQGPVFVGLNSQTADGNVAPRGVPSGWNLTTPFTPPPLYVFTSLQI